LVGRGTTETTPSSPPVVDSSCPAALWFGGREFYEDFTQVEDEGVRGCSRRLAELTAADGSQEKCQMSDIRQELIAGALPFGIWHIASSGIR
jgi:hypothetical protein